MSVTYLRSLGLLLRRILGRALWRHVEEDGRLIALMDLGPGWGGTEIGDDFL